MHFQTLLNIYKSIDSATFRFSFFPFNQVKGDFVLILAQGPTEGCGVIPVKGRRMCTDPDPGGTHSECFALQSGTSLDSP